MGGGRGRTPVPSVGDLSYGGGQPRGWPTATSPQAIATLPPRPRTNNDLQKKSGVFSDFFPAWPRGTPGWRPGGPARAAQDALQRGELIAQ